MNFVSFIEAKRDGQAHPAGQIAEMISEYVGGRIPDFQMAAWLMAVHFRRLTPDETAELTRAMRDSGEKLQFPKDARPLVDKHSTGGVGDKVSLPLAPLLACMGFRVPMISGRGLGITGGTLDKLESIDGFKVELELEQIVSNVQSVGCVICGQTTRMVPADNRLYTLRDMTATVPSIPLITASILSKKLAEGLDALVLDVKFGGAAFMSDPARANELAVSMVELGDACGVNTRALLTNMDRPLGRAAGNWLEVREAAQCLDGTGPADLRELVLTFAAHLLMQTGKAKSLADGHSQARVCLNSGKPRRKWDEMLAAQGADLEALNRKLAREHTAPVVRELESPQDGWVTRCDARTIGEVVRDLGGGRTTHDSRINHDVGVDMIAAPGSEASFGSVLCRVHAADAAGAEVALTRLKKAFTVAEVREEPDPLIAGVIES